MPIRLDDTAFLGKNPTERRAEIVPGHVSRYIIGSAEPSGRTDAKLQERDLDPW